MKTITKNLFKVLFLVMIGMSLMVTTSCEEDDDIDSIIGTWILHEVDMTVQGVKITMPAATTGMAITVEIREDKTYTATVSMTSEAGTQTDTETGTWVRLDDNTVKITNTLGDVTTLTKNGVFYEGEESIEGFGSVIVRFRKQ